MPRKTLQAQVELDIQAVTCPGVWLCPNGKISLQIYMLDSCIQTSGLSPVFPLLYHEKFIFYKTFFTARSLSDINRFIQRDCLYAELIQWQNCEVGNVLATFQTSLADVLYPTAYEGTLAGVDVDLLMEPSKNFPGIIAPKIEINTRTTIDEVVCASSTKKCASFVINHKTVSSDPNQCPSKSNALHQQKVCHSLGYHKSRKCSKTNQSKKPPFVMRKVQEDLLGRKPQGYESGSTNKCNCCLHAQSSNNLVDQKGEFPSTHTFSEQNFTKVTDNFLKRYQKHSKTNHRGVFQMTKQMCSCGSGHSEDVCPVCSKYLHYFEGRGCPCKPPTKTATRRGSPVKQSYVRKIGTRSPTSECCRQSSGSPMRTSVDKGNRQASQNMCECFHAPQKKPSLAEQLHHRLEQTLDCIPAFNSDQQSETDTPADCSCLYYQNCREQFNQNLGKFYKDLRTC